MATTPTKAPTFGNSLDGVDFGIETEEERKRRLLREVEDERARVAAEQAAEQARASEQAAEQARASALQAQVDAARAELDGVPPGGTGVDAGGVPEGYGPRSMPSPVGFAPTLDTPPTTSPPAPPPMFSMEWLKQNTPEVDRVTSQHAAIQAAQAAGGTPEEVREREQSIYNEAKRKEQESLSQVPLVGGVLNTFNRMIDEPMGAIGGVAEFIGRETGLKGLEEGGRRVNMASSVASHATDDKSMEAAPTDSVLSWFDPEFQKRDYGDSVLSWVQMADKTTSAYWLSHEGARTVGLMIPLVLGGEVLGAGIAGAAGMLRLGTLATKIPGVAPAIGRVAQVMGRSQAGRLLLKYGKAGVEALPDAIGSAVAESFVEASGASNEEFQKSGDREKASQVAGGVFTQGVVAMLGMNGAESLLIGGLLPSAFAKAMRSLPDAERNHVITRLASGAGEKAATFAATVWKEMGEEGVQQAIQMNPQGSLAGNITAGLFNPEKDAEIEKARRAGGTFTMMMSAGRGIPGGVADARRAAQLLGDTSTEDRRLLLGTYSHAVAEFIHDKAQAEIAELPPGDDEGRKRITSQHEELMSRAMDASRAIQRARGAWSNEEAGLGGVQSGVMARAQFASDVAEVQRHVSILEAMGPVKGKTFSSYLTSVASDNAQQQIGRSATTYSGLYGKATTVDVGGVTVTNASGNIPSALLNRIANRSYIKSVHGVVENLVLSLEEEWARADSYDPASGATPPPPHMLALIQRLNELKVRRTTGSAVGRVDITVDSQMGVNAASGEVGINIYRIVDKFYNPVAQPSLRAAYEEARSLGATETFEEYRTQLIAFEFQQTFVHEAGHTLGFEDDDNTYDDVIYALMVASDIEDWAGHDDILAFVRDIESSDEFLADMKEVANVEGTATRSRLSNLGLGEVQRAPRANTTGGVAQGDGRGFFTAGDPVGRGEGGVRARTAIASRDTAERNRGSELGGIARQLTSGGGVTAGGDLDDERAIADDIRSGAGPRLAQGSGGAPAGNDGSIRNPRVDGQGTDGDSSRRDSTEGLFNPVGYDARSRVGGIDRDNRGTLGAVDDAIRAVVAQRARSVRGVPATPAQFKGLLREGEFAVPDSEWDAVEKGPKESVLASGVHLPGDAAVDIASVTPLRGTRLPTFVGTLGGAFYDGLTPGIITNAIAAPGETPYAIPSPPSGAMLSARAFVQRIARETWTPKLVDALASAYAQVDRLMKKEGWVPDSTAWAPDPTNAAGKDLIALQGRSLKSAIEGLAIPPGTPGSHNFTEAHAAALAALAQLPAQGSQGYDPALNAPHEKVIADYVALRNLLTNADANWQQAWTPDLWRDASQAVRRTLLESGGDPSSMGVTADPTFHDARIFLLVAPKVHGVTAGRESFSAEHRAVLQQLGIPTSHTSSGFIGINFLSYFIASRVLLDDEFQKTYIQSPSVWVGVTAEQLPEIWARAMLALMIHESVHKTNILHGGYTQGDRTQQAAEYQEIVRRMGLALMADLDPALRSLAQVYTDLINNRDFVATLRAYDNLLKKMSVDISKGAAGRTYVSNVGGTETAPATVVENEHYLRALNSTATADFLQQSPWTALGATPLRAAAARTPATRTGAYPRVAPLATPASPSLAAVPATHATIASIIRNRPRSAGIHSRVGGKSAWVEGADPFGLDSVRVDIFGRPLLGENQTIGDLAIERLMGGVMASGYQPHTISYAVEQAIANASRKGRLPIASDFADIPGAPKGTAVVVPAKEKAGENAKGSSAYGFMHPQIYRHLIDLAEYGKDAKTWYLDYAQFFGDWIDGTYGGRFTVSQRQAMLLEMLVIMGRAGHQTSPAVNTRMTFQIMEMRGALEQLPGRVPGTSSFDDVVNDWLSAHTLRDTFASNVAANVAGYSQATQKALRAIGISVTGKTKDPGAVVAQGVRKAIKDRAEALIPLWEGRGNIPDLATEWNKDKEVFEAKNVAEWKSGHWNSWAAGVTPDDYLKMSSSDPTVEQLIRDVVALESTRKAVTGGIWLAYRGDSDTNTPPVITEPGAANTASSDLLESVLNFWLYARDEIAANMKLANYSAAFRDSIENIVTMFCVPDTWIFKVVGIRNPRDQGTASDPAVSEFVSALFADIATRMGVSPLQFQAMVWTGFRRRLSEGVELASVSMDPKSPDKRRAPLTIIGGGSIRIRQADGSDYVVHGVGMADVKSEGDLDKVLRDPAVMRTTMALAKQTISPAYQPPRMRISPVRGSDYMRAQRWGAAYPAWELEYPGESANITTASGATVNAATTPTSTRAERDRGNRSIEVQSPRIFIPMEPGDWDRLALGNTDQTPLLRQESHAYTASLPVTTPEEKSRAHDPSIGAGGLNSDGESSYGELVRGTQPARALGGVGKAYIPHFIIPGKDYIEVVPVGVSAARANVIASALAHMISPDRQAVVVSPTGWTDSPPNTVVLTSVGTEPFTLADVRSRFGPVAGNVVVMGGGTVALLTPPVGVELADLITTIVDDMGLPIERVTVATASMEQVTASSDAPLDVAEAPGRMLQSVLDSLGVSGTAPAMDPWSDSDTADARDTRTKAERASALASAQADPSWESIPDIARREEQAARNAVMKERRAARAGTTVTPRANLARSAQTPSERDASAREWTVVDGDYSARTYDDVGGWGRVIRRPTTRDFVDAGGDESYFYRWAVGGPRTISAPDGYYRDGQAGSVEEGARRADDARRRHQREESDAIRDAGIQSEEEYRQELSRTRSVGAPIDPDQWIENADRMDREDPGNEIFDIERGDILPASPRRGVIDVPFREGGNNRARRAAFVGSGRVMSELVDPSNPDLGATLDAARTISMSSPASVGTHIARLTGQSVPYEMSARPWQDVVASQEEFIQTVLLGKRNKNGTFSIPMITTIAGPHEIVTNRVGTWEGGPEYNIRVLFPVKADPALIRVAAAWLGRVTHQDGMGLFHPTAVMSARDFLTVAKARVNSENPGDTRVFNVVGVAIPEGITQSGGASDRAVAAVKQLALGGGVDQDASGRHIYVVNYHGGPPADAADVPAWRDSVDEWVAETAVKLRDAFASDGVAMKDVFVAVAETDLISASTAGETPWQGMSRIEEEGKPYETYGSIIRDYEDSLAASGGPTRRGGSSAGGYTFDSSGVARVPVDDYERRALEWNTDPTRGGIAIDPIVKGGDRATQLTEVQRHAQWWMGPDVPVETHTTGTFRGIMLRGPKSKARVLAADRPKYNARLDAQIAARRLREARKRQSSIIDFDNQTGGGMTTRARSGDSSSIVRRAPVEIGRRGKRMLAKSLYPQADLALSVREAFQNSRDAIRAALKKSSETGQTTPPEGYLFDVVVVGEMAVDNMYDGHHTGFVVMHDNGVGMSMDTVIKYFVTIGESLKEGDGASGGFGIGAGAVLASSQYFEMISTWIDPATGKPERIRFWGTGDEWISEEGPSISPIPTHTNTTPLVGPDGAVTWEIANPSLPSEPIPHPDPIIEIALQRLAYSHMGRTQGGGVIPSWVSQMRDPGSAQTPETILGAAAVAARMGDVQGIAVATPPDEDGWWLTEAEQKRSQSIVQRVLGRDNGQWRIPRPDDYYDVVGHVPGLEHVRVIDWGVNSPTYGKSVPILLLAYRALKENPNALEKYIRDRALIGNRAPSAERSATGTTITIWPQPKKGETTSQLGSTYRGGGAYSTSFQSSVRPMVGLLVPTISFGGAAGVGTQGGLEPVARSQSNMFVIPNAPWEMEQRESYPREESGGNASNNEFSWSHLDNPDQYLRENMTLAKGRSGQPDMPPAFSSGWDKANSTWNLEADQIDSRMAIGTLNAGRRLQDRSLAPEFVAEGDIPGIGGVIVARARLTASRAMAEKSRLIYLSNGAYQFTTFMSAQGDVRLPETLVIDLKVQGGIEADDEEYPFLPNRGGVKPYISNWWSRFSEQELITILRQQKSREVVGLFDDAPGLKGSVSGLKLLDPGGILTDEMRDALLSSVEMTNYAELMFSTLEDIKADVRMRNPLAPQAMFTGAVFGLTVGAHLGVNYNVSPLRHDATPAMIQAMMGGSSVLSRENSHLFNAFLILREELSKVYADQPGQYSHAVEPWRVKLIDLLGDIESAERGGLFNPSNPRGTKASLARFRERYASYGLLEQFARGSDNVVLHEETHQIAWRHDATYASALHHVEQMLGTSFSSRAVDVTLPRLFKGNSAATFKFIANFLLKYDDVLSAPQGASLLDRYTGNRDPMEGAYERGAGESGRANAGWTSAPFGEGGGARGADVSGNTRARGEEARGLPRGTDGSGRESDDGRGDFSEDQGVGGNRARSGGSYLSAYTHPRTPPTGPPPSSFGLSHVGREEYLDSGIPATADASYASGLFGEDVGAGELPPKWVSTASLLRGAALNNARVRGELASRAGNKATAYWYNNLLSGPAGALTDVISNAMSIPALMAKTAVTAGVESVLGVKRGDRTATASMVAGMGAAMITGGYHGFRDFITAFANGAEPIRGEQPRGMVDGKMGMIFEPISRIRVASDIAVFHMAETMAIHGLAYREASKEGLRHGSRAFARRVGEIIRDTSEELANGSPVLTPGARPAAVTQSTSGLAGEALRMSKEAVFQEKAPHLIGGLAEARGIDAGILNALVPFYRTIATIAYRGVDMTPVVGTAMLALDLARAPFDAGPYADRGDGRGILTRSPSDRTYLPATQRIANQLIGVAIAGLGATLVMMGMMTDGGPDDEDERSAMLDDGWRPWSFVTTNPDGTKEYTNFITLLGPAAFPLVFGASWAGSMQRSAADPDYHAVGAFAMAMRDFVFTQSGLKAYDDALNALGGNKRAMAAQLTVAKFTSGLVPSAGLLRAINASIDPTLRSPTGMLFKWFEEGSSFNGLASIMAESAMASIPGVSRFVAEKRNELGDVQERPPGQSGFRAFLPLQSTRQKTGGTYKYVDSTSHLDDAKVSNAVSKWDRYMEGVAPPPDDETAGSAIVHKMKVMRNPAYSLLRDAEERRRGEMEMEYRKMAPSGFGR